MQRRPPRAPDALACSTRPLAGPQIAVRGSRLSLPRLFWLAGWLPQSSVSWSPS
jgi:hypothetical protein